MLLGAGLRAGDGHGRLLVLAGVELRAAQQPGPHHQPGAFPLPRNALPDILP